MIQKKYILALKKQKTFGNSRKKSYICSVIYYWGTEAEAQVDAIVSTGMGTASYELAAATDPDSCHE